MSEPVTPEVKAARDLREIKRLYRELGSQIIADGISRNIADSNALNFLGPAAKVEQWQAAYSAAEAEAEARDETFVDYAQDQLGAEHPLGVLTYWDDLVRGERDQPTGLRATVNRAADYLRGQLPWIYGETDGDANFLGSQQFGRDLSDCRRALENVLNDGVRAEYTETPCDKKSCTGALLTKVYTESVADDFYRCSNRECREPYTREEYTHTRKVHMFSERADDAWIDISAAAKSIERSQFTIRQWMKFTKKYPGPTPRVRWRRTGKMKPIEVYWADVRDQDALAERRRIWRQKGHAA